MYIEVAELLRCTGDHEQMQCVVAPEVMDGRRVVRGTVGCPVCEAEHAIIEGIVGFGEDPLLGAGSRSDDLTIEEMPEPDSVQALLNLSGPGGYVALLGSGSRLGSALEQRTNGIHFIGVNPPPELRETARLSLLRSPITIPLRDDSVRGILVGREYVRSRWMDEAGRVLRRGGRMVAIFEQLAASGVRQLAAAGGLWVGEKESG